MSFYVSPDGLRAPELMIHFQTEATVGHVTLSDAQMSELDS